MKKKYISYIFVFIYLFSLLFSYPYNDNVKAITIVTLLSDWDDVSAGLDSGISNLFTFKNIGTINTGETSTTYQYSDYNSFKVSVNANVYWNLSTSCVNVSSITFYFLTNPVTGTVSLDFYDSLGNAVIQWQMNSQIVKWNDVSSGWHSLYSVDAIKWYCLNIGHISTNQFRIILYNETLTQKGIWYYAGSYAGTFTGFKYCKTGGTGSNIATYFDDIRIVTTGGTTPLNCSIDHSGWYSMGNDIANANTMLDGDYGYIGFYNDYTSVNITAQALIYYTSSNQFNGDSNLSNYWLFINGATIGNPVCFYQVSPLYYAMEFDLFNTSYVEEFLYFDILHTQKIGSTNHYWYITCDSVYPSFWGLQYSLYADNKMTYLDLTKDSYNQWYRPCWKLYYTNPWEYSKPHKDDCNFSCDIVLNNGFSGEKFGLPKATQYTETSYTTYINRTDNYYQISFYDTDTATLENEYDISNCYQDFKWTPMVYGNHSVNITHNGISVIGYYFYVDELIVPPGQYIYRIWTEPAQTINWGTYTVWIYASNLTQFTDYYIFMWADSSFVGETDNYNERIFVSSIDNNGLWSTSYTSFIATGIEYWGFYGTDNNVLFVQLYSCQHKVGQNIVLIDDIYTSLQPLNIGYTDTSFNIYFVNSHTISTVKIFIDNTVFKDVTGRSSGYENCLITTKGIKTLRLMLYINGDYQELDRCMVSIIVRGQNNNPNNGTGGFIISIPPPYSYFAGIFIIIIFTLSPLIIITGFSRASGREFNLGSIPQFLYFICAIIGFIISIIFGWFPVWSVAVLVIMCVLIIVILYLQKKGTVST